MMNPPARHKAVLAAALIALCAWSLVLAHISAAFLYGDHTLSKPVLAFVLLQVSAGGVYLLALWLLHRAAASKLLLLAVFGVGIVVRGAQLSSTPILEDDYYRYLWDGALSARAVNPYALTPDEVRTTPQVLPANLVWLAEDGGTVLERINHPSLRTIYPPIAQLGFAVAHWVRPFDIIGLRWTWLAIDLVIAGLLWALLRDVDSRVFQFAIYWLNPLLVKEVYNSGHMELIVIVTVLAALLAAVRRRTGASALLLALAAGAKVWPALWLPFLLRCAARTKRQIMLGAAAFAGTLSILALPMITGRLDGDSGLMAYARSWQMNDSAYRLIHGAARLLEPTHAHLAARVTIVLLLLATVVWLMRLGPVTRIASSIAGSLRCAALPGSRRVAKSAEKMKAGTADSAGPASLRDMTNGEETLLGHSAPLRSRGPATRSWFFGSALVVTAMLFMLSPTQFPWYYLWLVPLLALKPSWALLALTVTLPVYYLRYPLEALGEAVWFDYGLVWLEFVPIWLLLGMGLYKRTRLRAGGEPVNSPSCSPTIA